MKRRFHETYGFGAGQPTRAPHLARIVLLMAVLATFAALWVVTW